MNRYAAITADVRSALAASSIEVYPEDYRGNIVTENHFAKYSILLPDAEPYDYDRKVEVDGLLIIRLFCASGFAGADCYADADLLNSVMEDKQFNNTTRFGKSTMTTVSVDKDNESLSMAIYSIPLTYHEK